MINLRVVLHPAGKAGRMGTTVPAAAADGPCSPGRPRRNAAVAATAAIKRDADHDAAEPMRRHKRRVLPAGMLMSNAGGAVGQADLEEEMSGVQAVGDDDDDKSNDEQEEDEPEQQVRVAGCCARSDAIVLGARIATEVVYPCVFAYFWVQSLSLSCCPCHDSVFVWMLAACSGLVMRLHVF